MTNERKLTVEDIAVPEFMLDAACATPSGIPLTGPRKELMRRDLATALLALTVNMRSVKISPSVAREIAEKWKLDPKYGSAEAIDITAYILGRIFLAPTPALPEEVKALEWDAVNPYLPDAKATAKAHNEAIAKAYALGLAGKESK